MYISAAFVRGKKVSYWTLSALSAGQQQTLYQGPAPPPPQHTHMGTGVGGGHDKQPHSRGASFPKGLYCTGWDTTILQSNEPQDEKSYLTFHLGTVMHCSEKKTHPQKKQKKKRVPKTKWTVFLHPSTWLIEKNPTSFQLFLVFLKRKQVAGPGWYEVLQNCVSKHIWPADAPINF